MRDMACVEAECQSDKGASMGVDAPFFMGVTVNDVLLMIVEKTVPIFRFTPPVMKYELNEVGVWIVWLIRETGKNTVYFALFSLAILGW